MYVGYFKPQRPAHLFPSNQLIPHFGQINQIACKEWDIESTLKLFNMTFKWVLNSESK